MGRAEILFDIALDGIIKALRKTLEARLVVTEPKDENGVITCCAEKRVSTPPLASLNLMGYQEVNLKCDGEAGCA